MVVTRYFGGVKLGFGGLARAYRETALLAIEKAEIIEVFEQIRLKIRVGYPESQKIRNMIKEQGSLEEEKYSEIVEFILFVRKDLENDLIENIKNQTKNKAEIERL